MLPYPKPPVPKKPPEEYPSLAYFFQQLKSKLTGKRDYTTIADMMSPKLKSTFTPEFLKFVETVPAIKQTPGRNASGMVGSGGFVGTKFTGKFPLDKGEMFISPDPQYKNISDTILLHEALHAYSMINNINPDVVTSKLTPQSAREIYARSKWGRSGPEPQEYHTYSSEGAGGSNTPEVYAFAGMYGWNNIPNELKDQYAKVFLPNDNPPDVNPSATARKRAVAPPAPSFVSKEKIMR